MATPYATPLIQVAVTRIFPFGTFPKDIKR